MSKEAKYPDAMFLEIYRGAIILYAYNDMTPVDALNTAIEMWNAAVDWNTGQKKTKIR